MIFTNVKIVQPNVCMNCISIADQAGTIIKLNTATIQKIINRLGRSSRGASVSNKCIAEGACTGAGTMPSETSNSVGPDPKQFVKGIIKIVNEGLSDQRTP